MKTEAVLTLEIAKLYLILLGYSYTSLLTADKSL